LFSGSRIDFLVERAMVTEAEPACVLALAVGVPMALEGGRNRVVVYRNRIVGLQHVVDSPAGLDRLGWYRLAAEAAVRAGAGRKVRERSS